MRTDSGYAVIKMAVKRKWLKGDDEILSGTTFWWPLIAKSKVSIVTILDNKAESVFRI